MYPFLKSPWFISLNHTLNNFVSIIHIHAEIVNGISNFRLTIYGLKFMDLFALHYTARSVQREPPQTSA